MPREHEQIAFYKFADLATARVMVEKRTTRWRTPLQFNDPFDVQTRIRVAINETAYVDRFLQRFRELVYVNPVPAFFQAGNDVHEAAMVVRQLDGVNKAAAVAQFRASLERTAGDLGQHFAKFSDEIAGHLQHGRVFCMAEDVNNVVMWSHYADNHRGVGFKFRVLDDIDHVFLLARRVTYDHAYLTLTDGEALADHFSKAKEMDLAALCWQLVYLKHVSWGYEREWRSYEPLLDRPAGAGFDDHVEPTELFESVYLGCCMSDDEAGAMVDHVKQHMPKTNVWRARKSATSFDLEFDEIYAGGRV